MSRPGYSYHSVPQRLSPAFVEDWISVQTDQGFKRLTLDPETSQQVGFVLTPAERGFYNRRCASSWSLARSRSGWETNPMVDLKEGSRFNRQWTAPPCSWAQDRHACGSAIHSGGIRRSQYSQVR